MKMNKRKRIFLRLLAAVFFILGALVLPFGVWTVDDLSESSNPALDWTWSIANVAIPWLISIALVRRSMRKDEQ